MSNPHIIFPADGQALWQLMEDLEALGGVRHQDFHVTSGLPRQGYQVTPELYEKWVAAGGDGSSDEPDASPAEESTPDTGDDTADEPAAKATDTGDETPAQEDAADGKTTTASKTAPKASTTTTTTKSSTRK